MAAQYALWQQYADDLLTGYSSQFTDMVNPPWMALRYYPGDESNAKWQAILAQNALGPFVDTTPPATGSYSFLGGFGTESSSTGSPVSFTINFGSNAAGVVAVTYAGQAALPTGGTLTTPSSGTLNFTQVGSTGVFYVVAPANMGTQTLTFTFASAGFTGRTFAVWLLTNLISNSPYTYGNQTTATSILLLPYVEGGAVLWAGTNANGFTSGAGVGYGTNGLLLPTAITVPTSSIASPGVQFNSLVNSSPAWGIHSLLVAGYSNPRCFLAPSTKN